MKEPMVAVRRYIDSFNRIGCSRADDVAAEDRSAASFDDQLAKPWYARR
jgi:hypothetical protein